MINRKQIIINQLVLKVVKVFYFGLIIFRSKCGKPWEVKALICDAVKTQGHGTILALNTFQTQRFKRFKVFVRFKLTILITM